MKLAIAVFLSLMTSLAMAQIPRSPAPESAELEFISPLDGATVSGPVKVQFGLRNMGVAPAGAFQNPATLTQFPNTGHHHIIIDGELPAMDMPIPADATYVHFGTGATETTLNLEPGEHTLQLILGDAMHVPHVPAVISEKITITVE